MAPQILSKLCILLHNYANIVEIMIYKLSADQCRKFYCIALETIISSIGPNENQPHISHISWVHIYYGGHTSIKIYQTLYISITCRQISTLISQIYNNSPPIENFLNQIVTMNYYLLFISRNYYSQELLLLFLGIIIPRNYYYYFQELLLFLGIIIIISRNYYYYFQ